MNILVSDFDGTITRRDFYLLVGERFIDKDAGYWDRYLRREISHFEAMRLFLEHTPDDDQVIGELLRDAGLDEGFRDGVARLRTAGWEVEIVSAGCSWYIERALDMAGVRIPVHSNPGRMEGGRLRMQKHEASWPYYCPDVGVNKPAVVAGAMRRAGRVAFAGDSSPDLAAALLVPAGLRFARGWLASELERRGEGFRRFERWSEIVAMLMDDQQLSS